LFAQAGGDAASRYVALVALGVKDPDVVAEWLARGEGDGHLSEVLRGWVEHVAICFAEQSRVAELGEDWAYSFLRAATQFRFGAREGGRVLHLPDGASLELEGLDAFMEVPSYPHLRVRVKRVARDAPYLALAEHVVSLFHAAIESDPDAPSVARARYDRLSPCVERIDDLGRNVTYHRGRTTTLDLIPTSLRGGG
jgi:hypothetical protein